MSVVTITPEIVSFADWERPKRGPQTGNGTRNEWQWHVHNGMQDTILLGVVPSALCVRPMCVACWDCCLIPININIHLQRREKCFSPRAVTRAAIRGSRASVTSPSLSYFPLRSPLEHVPLRIRVRPEARKCPLGELESQSLSMVSTARSRSRYRSRDPKRYPPSWVGGDHCRLVSYLTEAPIERAFLHSLCCASFCISMNIRILYKSNVVFLVLFESCAMRVLCVTYSTESEIERRWRRPVPDITYDSITLPSGHLFPSSFEIRHPVSSRRARDRFARRVSSEAAKRPIFLSLHAHGKHSSVSAYALVSAARRETRDISSERAREETREREERRVSARARARVRAKERERENERRETVTSSACRISHRPEQTNAIVARVPSSYGEPGLRKMRADR